MDTVYSSYYESPIGNLLLTSDGKAVTGIWVEGQKYYAATLKGKVLEDEGLEVLEKTRDWLDRYFSGQKPDHRELSLAPEGSEFRQRVWQLLLEIPYGETRTYGEIARLLAGSSARAVGGAVGHNPITLIIPCHRVLGAGGKLTGFASGLAKKTWLLEHEGGPATV